MSLTVTIEKLVFGGQGLARTDQGVVFVPGALPGERVDIRITGTKARSPLAEILRVVEPSPHRQSPPCRYAGECGGCDWQHITCDAQPQLKEDILADCFARIGKLPDLPPVASFCASQWNCRCRAQFKMDRERGSLGFFRKNTNDVVTIEECPLLVAPLNDLLRQRENILAALPPHEQQIFTVAGTDGTVATAPRLDGLTCEETQIEVAGLVFRVAGNDFFQSNALLAHELGSWPAACVSGERFVDVYGGTGFFSAFLSTRFRRGVLVESLPQLAKNATRTFLENGISSVSVCEATAEDYLESRAARDFAPDCVVLDPPRPGLSKRARIGLGQLRPRDIVYVSCNPSTQARDIGFLVSKRGYVVKKVALFELYPHTHHMESVMHLRRREDCAQP